jgi:hypothetical protein
MVHYGFTMPSVGMGANISAKLRHVLLCHIAAAGAAHFGAARSCRVSVFILIWRTLYRSISFCETLYVYYYRSLTAPVHYYMYRVQPTELDRKLVMLPPALYIACANIFLSHQLTQIETKLVNKM